MLKQITGYHKRLRITYIKTAAVVAATAAFFLPYFHKLEATGDNMFTVSLNGTTVGVVAEPERAEECLQEVRRQIASWQTELVFADVDMQVEGQEVLIGKIDDEKDIMERMEAIVQENIKETMQRSYVVKVNDYMVNLNSVDEARSLLQAAVNQYDPEGLFQVELVHDNTREFNVLTARVANYSEEAEVEVGSQAFLTGGIQDRLFSMFEDVEPVGEKGFEDYELGLMDMNFAEEVEIVEAYLDTSEITPLDTAIEQVIKEQEVNTIYKVVAGDTLSEISINVNIPVDKLVAMNDSLEDETSILHIGQELIITVPEPELSVERTEQLYYEESYDADVIYVPNDSWYTTQTKTLQEPSAGFRKVVVLVSYTNNSETGRQIVKEEVVMEAVPKIVERGTKNPPTFIRPISGGRTTSPFGRRSAPIKGASTYHRGIDWAIPTGSKVVASSGGTVTKAGWTSGGGYSVYINHGNGTETRYKHLSKILVKVGQKVSQGQQIAKSGNTGVSTGPHLHFEIIINGSAVNPNKYMK